MAGILKSKTATYEFNPESILALIAQELEVRVDQVEVHYVIQEVGGDSLDRFRGVDTVTKIRVIVTE